MLLTDTQLDLSSITGAIFQPVVTSGLKIFSLFGVNLGASLVNMANSAEPWLRNPQGSSPTFLNPSGMQGNHVNNLLAAEPPEAGSETIISVWSCVPTGTLPVSSFASRPLGTGGDFASAGQGLQISVSTGDAVIRLYGATNNGNISMNPGIGASDGFILGQSLQSQTIIATPQCYAAVVDTTTAGTITATFENLSQAGVPGWSASTSVQGTRTTPSTSIPYSVPAADDQNCTTTVYAFAKYNRALSSAETTAVYEQFKRLLANRGVTI